MRLAGFGGVDSCRLDAEVAGCDDRDFARSLSQGRSRPEGAVHHKSRITQLAPALHL